MSPQVPFHLLQAPPRRIGRIERAVYDPGNSRLGIGFGQDRNSYSGRALHVPYKGGSAAVTDLTAERISFASINPLEVVPHIKAGKLRALAALDKLIKTKGIGAD